MTFKVAQHGLPANNRNQVDGIYAYQAGANYSNGKKGDIYYNADVQKGTWLIWSPEDDEQAKREWDKYETTITLPSYEITPPGSTNNKTYYYKNSTIKDILKNLSYIIEQYYNKEIFISQVNKNDYVYPESNVYIPTLNELGLAGPVNYGAISEPRYSLGVLELFKNQNKPIFFTDYNPAFITYKITKNGETARLDSYSGNSITANQTEKVVLRPMLILDSKKTTVNQDSTNKIYYINNN